MKIRILFSLERRFLVEQLVLKVVSYILRTQPLPNDMFSVLRHNSLMDVFSVLKMCLVHLVNS